jgi:hypothetical protein
MCVRLKEWMRVRLKGMDVCEVEGMDVCEVEGMDVCEVEGMDESEAGGNGCGSSFVTVLKINPTLQNGRSFYAVLLLVIRQADCCSSLIVLLNGNYRHAEFQDTDVCLY